MNPLNLLNQGVSTTYTLVSNALSPTSDSSPSHFSEDEVKEGAKCLEELSKYAVVLKENGSNPIIAPLLSPPSSHKEKEGKAIQRYKFMTIFFREDCGLLEKCWGGLDADKKTALLYVLQSDAFMKYIVAKEVHNEASCFKFLQSWGYLLQQKVGTDTDTDKHEINFNALDTPTLKVVWKWFVDQNMMHKLNIPREVQKNIAERIVDDLTSEAWDKLYEAFSQPTPTSSESKKFASYLLSYFVIPDKRKSTSLENEGVPERTQEIGKEDGYPSTYLIDGLSDSDLENAVRYVKKWEETFEDPLCKDFERIKQYKSSIGQMHLYFQAYPSLKKQAEGEAVKLRKTGFRLFFSELPDSQSKFKDAFIKFERTLIELWGVSAAINFSTRDGDIRINAATSLHPIPSQAAAFKKNNEEKISDRLQISFDTITRSSRDSTSIWPASYLSQFVAKEIQLIFSELKNGLSLNDFKKLLSNIPLEQFNNLREIYQIFPISNISELAAKENSEIQKDLFEEVLNRVTGSLSELKNLKAEPAAFDILNNEMYVLDIFLPPVLNLALKTKAEKESGETALDQALKYNEGKLFVEIQEGLKNLCVYIENFFEKINGFCWSEAAYDIQTLEKYREILTRAYNYHASDLPLRKQQIFQNITKEIQNKLQASCEEQAQLFYINILKQNADKAIDYFYKLRSNHLKSQLYYDLSTNSSFISATNSSSIALTEYIEKAGRAIFLEKKEDELSSITSIQAYQTLQRAINRAGSSIDSDRPHQGAQLKDLASCLSMLLLPNDEHKTFIPPSLFNEYREAIKKHFHIDLGQQDAKILSIAEKVKAYPIFSGPIPKVALGSIKINLQKGDKEKPLYKIIKSVPEIIGVSPQFMDDIKRNFISAIYIDGKEYNFSKNPQHKRDIVLNILQDFCKYHDELKKNDQDFRLFSFWLSQGATITEFFLGRTGTFFIETIPPIKITPIESESRRTIVFYLNRQHDGSIQLKIVVHRDKISEVMPADIPDSVEDTQKIQCQPNKSFIRSEITVQLDSQKTNPEEQVKVLGGEYKYKLVAVKEQQNAYDSLARRA